MTFAETVEHFDLDRKKIYATVARLREEASQTKKKDANRRRLFY
jgi:hypothetical protein